MCFIRYEIYRILQIITFITGKISEHTLSFLFYSMIIINIIIIIIIILLHKSTLSIMYMLYFLTLLFSCLMPLNTQIIFSYKKDNAVDKIKPLLFLGQHLLYMG